MSSLQNSITGGAISSHAPNNQLGHGVYMTRDYQVARAYSSYHENGVVVGLKPVQSLGYKDVTSAGKNQVNSSRPIVSQVANRDMGTMDQLRVHESSMQYFRITSIENIPPLHQQHIVIPHESIFSPIQE